MPPEVVDTSRGRYCRHGGEDCPPEEVSACVHVEAHQCRGRVGFDAELSDTLDVQGVDHVALGSGRST